MKECEGDLPVASVHSANMNLVGNMVQRGEVMKMSRYPYSKAKGTQSAQLHGQGESIVHAKNIAQVDIGKLPRG